MEKIQEQKQNWEKKQWAETEETMGISAQQESFPNRFKSSSNNDD